MRLLFALAALALSACLSTRSDHFYLLIAQPSAAPSPRSAAPVSATLRITVPAAVDRAQMTLESAADGVQILEHERWAAPLAELSMQALGTNLEHRRADYLVGAAGGASVAAPAVRIAVDLVQVHLQAHAPARIEAHWRILDVRDGSTHEGSGLFTSRDSATDYAGIARALSDCMGQLADQIAVALPGAR